MSKRIDSVISVAVFAVIVALVSACSDVAVPLPPQGEGLGDGPDAQDEVDAGPSDAGIAAVFGERAVPASGQ